MKLFSSPLPLPFIPRHIELLQPQRCVGGFCMELGQPIGAGLVGVTQRTALLSLLLAHSLRLSQKPFIANVLRIKSQNSIPAASLDYPIFHAPTYAGLRNGERFRHLL
jgi:hypothetical protein